MWWSTRGQVVFPTAPKRAITCYKDPVRLGKCTRDVAKDTTDSFSNFVYGVSFSIIHHSPDSSRLQIMTVTLSGWSSSCLARLLHRPWGWPGGRVVHGRSPRDHSPNPHPAGCRSCSGGWKECLSGRRFPGLWHCSTCSFDISRRTWWCHWSLGPRSWATEFSWEVGPWTISSCNLTPLASLTVHVDAYWLELDHLHGQRSQFPCAGFVYGISLPFAKIGNEINERVQPIKQVSDTCFESERNPQGVPHFPTGSQTEGTMGHLLTCTPIKSDWLAKKIPIFVQLGSNRWVNRFRLKIHDHSE